MVRAGAPGGSRTHTGILLRDLPLPVGLRGRFAQRSRVTLYPRQPGVDQEAVVARTKSAFGSLI